jgi:hypothetical protein
MFVEFWIGRRDSTAQRREQTAPKEFLALNFSITKEPFLIRKIIQSFFSHLMESFLFDTFISNLYILKFSILQ